MNLGAVRKNAALLAGIFLPLLLILLVWGAQKIAEVSVPDPQYALVYCDCGHYWNGNTFDVRVENGRIMASSKVAERKDGSVGRGDFLLVYVNGATGERKTARLLEPVEAAPGSVVTIPIPEPFASLKIHEGEKAPDGYQVEGLSNDYRGGISREVFGGQNRGKIVVSKNGRNIALRTDAPYWGSIKILGWAEP